MSEHPPFLPLEIANLSTPCPKCGAQLKPDLWKRFDEPFTPVYPNGTKGEKGAWIQQTALVRCPCGGSVEFHLNPKDLQHGIFFYGDDADRRLGRFYLHSYSMIGGTSGPISDLCRDVRMLKERYISDREADSWRIHTTNMMSGQKRITHAVYRRFTFPMLLSFFGECADLLKKNENRTWNTHVFGLIEEPSVRKERGKAINEVKMVCNQALLAYVIYKSTKQNLRPFFRLDSSKPIKKYPHIEAWSHDGYLNSRHYLGHAFLTHSNDISPPEFVEPGSHPCLELADVHAFFAARSIFKRGNAEIPEISLTQFGNFFYLTVSSGEKFEHLKSDDIPRAWFP